MRTCNQDMAGILIVEDEKIIAQDLKMTLNNFGYDVPAIASSGEDAIIKTAEIIPDLILMDIMLAGELNGIETAKQILGKHSIPLIYISAYADENTILAAKETKPFGYLVKPFEEQELHSIIRIALGKEKVN